MMFKKDHIKKIKNGTKTATRRKWAWRMRKPDGGRHNDGVYGAKTRIFQPLSKREVFYKVKSVYKQKLGDMTEEDADKEGGYNLLEFKVLWELMHGRGSWHPWLTVYVVEFEYVPRKEYFSKEDDDNEENDCRGCMHSAFSTESGTQT